MNDRFKFRVWAKPDEKTDTEGYYVDDADYMVMHPDGTAEITYYVDDGYAGKIDRFEQDEIIIEQCTGLKDKNGNLIYEGDIILVEDKYKCPIEWEAENARYNVIGYGEIAYLNYNDIEVIGNIHENTELLKEE